MLINFKSKSQPEVLMYQKHAQRFLDLLHKNPARGIITAEEAGHALAVLEQEVAHSKAHPEKDVHHDIHMEKHEEDAINEHIQAQHVDFSTRVFPLMEMLRQAQAEGEDIVWGV